MQGAPVVETDGVLDLHIHVPEAQEVVGGLRRARNLGRPCQPQDRGGRHLRKVAKPFRKVNKIVLQHKYQALIFQRNILRNRKYGI